MTSSFTHTTGGESDRSKCWRTRAALKVKINVTLSLASLIPCKRVHHKLTGLGLL